MINFSVYLFINKVHTKFGCKFTTNYSNMQGFSKKNIVYACISSIFWGNPCCLHDSANVNSVGTRLREDRSYHNKLTYLF